MSWHVFMEATGWIVWGGCGLVMLWLLIRWSADFLSLPISSRTWTTCDKTRHEANKWSEEKRADLLKKGMQIIDGHQQKPAAPPKNYGEKPHEHLWSRPDKHGHEYCLFVGCKATRHLGKPHPADGGY
jgi:hypothetical protein